MGERIKKLHYPTAIYLVSRIVFVLIVGALYCWDTYYLGKTFRLEHGMGYLFSQFDSSYFIQIAENGYQSDLLVKDGMYSFFPLFPLLISGLHYFTGIPYLYAGVVLNFFFSLGSTLLLYHFASEKWKKEVVFLFCFNPVTYFFIVNYSESLFFFLSLISYYFYKKEKYVWTGLIVGLSMLTRNAGYIWLFALTCILLYEIYLKRKSIKSLLKIYMLAIPLALLYPIYTYNTKGNAFLFIQSQTYWNKVQGWILDTWFMDFHRLFDSTIPGYPKFVIVVTFVLWVFVLIISILHFKKNPLLSLFLLVGSCYPLFAKIVEFTPHARATRSLMRYMLGLFPIYFIIPLFYRKYGGSFVRIGFLVLYLFVIVSVFYMKFID